MNKIPKWGNIRMKHTGMKEWRHKQMKSQCLPKNRMKYKKKNER